MTLVELLIVILIMLLITAVVIRATAPALAGRRVREAARMLDVYINGARSRALQTGRSYGVMIERTPVLNAGLGLMSSSMGIGVAYAEVPPPYNGDYAIQPGSNVYSQVLLLGNGMFGAINPMLPGADPTSSMFRYSDYGWVETVSPGDIIVIKGTQYRIYAGEPYIDLNNSGQWEIGEPFLDCNLSGFCDTPTNSGPNFPYYALINSYIDQKTGFFNLSGGSPPQYGTGLPAWTIMYFDLARATSENKMTLTGRDASGNPIAIGPGPSVETVPGTPASANGWAFQIIRRPIKAAGTEQQLPDGAAIDLGGLALDTPANPPSPLGLQAYVVPGSGMDTFPNYFAAFRPNINPPFQPNPALPNYAPDISPVIITFAPNGIVDKVYSWDERNVVGAWQGRQPTSPIFLLVTRRELVGGDASVTATPSAATPQYGIQDLDSLWVTINPQTGLVNTAANGAIGAALFTAPMSAPPGRYALQCYEARQNARNTQNVGGR